MHNKTQTSSDVRKVAKSCMSVNNTFLYMKHILHLNNKDGKRD